MSLPPLSHLIFEAAVYVLFPICLWHAWRQGRAWVLLLVATAVYATVVEYMGLHPIRPEPKMSLLACPACLDYQYGRFLVMLFGELPLCIVLGWSVIIYAALQTTQKLGAAPWWQRPFIAALLALTLDFLMDPVASAASEGLWSWDPGSITDVYWWMKVPLTNFVGWYTIIVTLSFFTLLAWRRWPPGQRSIWPDMAIMFGVVVASLLANTAILLVYLRFIWEKVLEPWYLVALLLLAIVVFVAHARNFHRDNPLDTVVIAVPLFFLLYFLLTYFLDGLAGSLPAMLPFALGLFGLGLLLYFWPYQQTLFSRSAQPASQ
jgi:hypothetical protein